MNIKKQFCLYWSIGIFCSHFYAQDSKEQTTKKVKLSTSYVTTFTDTEAFQSASQINKNALESTPSGNGDITSILKIVPNVQFDNAQLKSSTPGEIDPANVSISGGLFYQNNFQLDGFNMNNDLDPNGGTTNGPNAMRSGRSQGLAVDSSLLDSIQVQDSNISAAYGGFSGGVIEANVRKPRRDKGGILGWHGGLSYQFTGDKLTQYFIDPSGEQNFITSSNENYQPHFTKHLIRANIEGYATDNLGVIASFSTTRSFIPLKAYSFNIGTEVNSVREQHRFIDNYYLKTYYNPTEKLAIEASIAYMPQDNTYYNNIAKDSFYSMKSGGIQSGVKALYSSDLGLWSNQIGYSFMQNSRESEKNYFMAWKASGDKNWANTNATGVASEGGYGDMEQVQNTLNYKSDMNFEPIEYGLFAQNFRIGFEANYVHSYRNRLNPYYAFGTPAELKNATCGQDSMFDFETCSNVATNNGWSGGQFFDKVTESKAGEIVLDNFAYGFYGEDLMQFDLKGFGEVNTRLGLRLDGDTYMSKLTLAPRLSLNYIVPWESYKSSLIFGANRYYGRNLLSYRLYELVASNTQSYTRPNPNSPWVSTSSKDGSSGYIFKELNVPYSDELMAGLTQNLGVFDMVFKYIYRAGRDEVMRKSQKIGTSSFTTWSNEGKSDSHIFTISVQNAKPLEAMGVKNYAIFAFDWTKTKRSYNLYAADDAYLENEDILYDGQFIKYQDRPLENFARPFTLRLSTIHNFTLWRTKWLLNNFFRYRGGYEAMVLLQKGQNGYDPSHPNTKQYGKMYFDGAFTWDIRLGTELNVYNGHILFINVDVYNVLNARNMASLGSANGIITPGIPSSTSVAVYELGRQFWLQVGYKF